MAEVNNPILFKSASSSSVQFYPSDVFWSSSEVNDLIGRRCYGGGVIRRVSLRFYTPCGLTFRPRALMYYIYILDLLQRLHQSLFSVCLHLTLAPSRCSISHLMYFIVKKYLDWSNILLCTSGTKNFVLCINNVFCSYDWCIQVIFGGRWRHLVGEPELWERVGGVDIAFTLASFGQANTQVHFFLT